MVWLFTFLGFLAIILLMSLGVIFHNKYIKCAEKGETTELARDIGLAKAWIVVEVVNILVSRENPQTSKYLDWFRQTLPQWAKSLSAQVMS